VFEDRLLTPSSKEIDWTAGLKKGAYVEGVLASSGSRLTGLPGSLAGDAGLPKSGVIWQNRKIFFRIMEGDSMDRLEAMSTFLTVVEQGSLSAAARQLKTPLTTVSRNVSELESHLRTKLFNRSSRQLVLTDAGTSYVAACKRILTDVTEAEDTTRIGVPASSPVGAVYSPDAVRGP
jgi:molybdenum-dependent DNA-binding transcriptional regulator ModE